MYGIKQHALRILQKSDTPFAAPGLFDKTAPDLSCSLGTAAGTSAHLILEDLNEKDVSVRFQKGERHFKRVNKSPHTTVQGEKTGAYSKQRQRHAKN